MEEIFEKAWRGFHGDSWKEEIDLSNFIVRNFTEYKGGDSFLAGPTDKTKAVWSKCEKLLEEENKNGGCLDVETNILSGITAFAPGYIDKTVRVYKTTNAKTITYQLEVDEAYNASEARSDLANK